MLKKNLRIVAIIIGIPVCLILIALVIGIITDAITTPAIKAKGDSALKELIALRKEGKDNAWNYYSQAIALMKEKTFPTDINKYLRGEIGITDEIIVSLNINKDVIILMEKGAMQPYCSMPLEYEKGIEMPLPVFVVLQECAKIHAAQALSALEIGVTNDGLLKTLHGLNSGKHIISGSPFLLTYMVGLVTIGRHLHVLESGVATGIFDKQQLETTSHYLAELERTLPSLLWSLEGEIKTINVSLAAKPLNYESLLAMEIFEGSIFHDIGLRIWMWRYLFSPRLATLKAIKTWDDMIATLHISAKGKEGSTEYDIIIAHHVTKDEMKKHCGSNPISMLFMPNLEPMFRRKSRVLAKARLIRCAALVWKYRIEHGTFPGSLKEINNAAIKDPFRDGTWDYVITKHSFELKSPGYNLVYDDDDDLSITLNKGTVREYLSTKKEK